VDLCSYTVACVVHVQVLPQAEHGRLRTGDLSSGRN
jgi:hypothetical protein